MTIVLENLDDVEKLGYTYSSYSEPANIGNKITGTIKDSNGNFICKACATYGNGSGYGYAKSGVIYDCIKQLEAILNEDNVEENQLQHNLYFLNELANYEIITEYGYDTNNNLILLFDSWQQLEGSEDSPSTFQKLMNLCEKGLLKEDITFTLKEAETGFTDSYGVCSGCGKIIDLEWEGLTYLENSCEFLCDECINSSSEAVEELIESAREDFRNALKVTIKEEILEELGYVKLDTENDFSTRYESWGEKDYGSHNINHEVLEELCKKYNGFPKLEAVWQFDCTYNCWFPQSTIELARAELKDITE